VQVGASSVSHSPHSCECSVALSEELEVSEKSELSPLPAQELKATVIENAVKTANKIDIILFIL
jgi:hypothetical protein